MGGRVSRNNFRERKREECPSSEPGTFLQISAGFGFRVRSPLQLSNFLERRHSQMPQDLHDEIHTHTLGYCKSASYWDTCES